MDAESGGGKDRIDAYCMDRLTRYRNTIKMISFSGELEDEISRVAGEGAVEHSRLMDGAAGAPLYEAYGAAADDDFERVDAVLETIGRHKGPKWTAETKAGICSMAGRMEEALHTVQSYNRDAPVQEWLFTVEADLLYRLNMLDVLKALCVTWKDFVLERFEMHLNRARVMHKTGNLKRAERIVNALLILEPLDSMARLLKGDILVQLGRYDDAVNHYDKGLSVSDDIMLLTARVRALLKGGRIQEALEDCDEFLSEFPDHREFKELRKAVVDGSRR